MSTADKSPGVVGVAVLRPHVMRVLFDDGVVRDVQYLPGEAHAPLLDPLNWGEVKSVGQGALPRLPRRDSGATH